MTRKKLTVVIVNYNVKHFLDQCLRSVEKASHNIDIETYVVDNNSVDGSCGMVIQKHPWVKLIANKDNVGFSRANNQAIELSNAEYILLLNPDTVVREDTFVKILSHMDEHADIGCLGVKMIDGKGKFLPESKRGLPTPWVAFYKIFGLSALFPKSKRFGKYHLSYLDKDETHEVDVLSGAFMLLRKSAIDISGSLDEDYFMYGEDIDLSYKIQKAGFKVCYFADTTIIHYKGESTKKGSLNYVRIFYNAMIIFARKHFSQNNAGLFSLIINVAIYFRAAISILSRLVKRFALPAFDFTATYLVLRNLLLTWENSRYEPGYYSKEILTHVLPIYILIWLISMFYMGGYEKPTKLVKIFKGIGYGTIAIIVTYALLPESIRFSRAFIFIGTTGLLLTIYLIRILMSLILRGDYRIGAHPPKRIAIVGNKNEGERIANLLQETGTHTENIGYIHADKEIKHSSDYIGAINQIEEIIQVNNIQELVFCSSDITSDQVIQLMTTLTNYNLDYKIAPPSSMSIIGSNSIETAGELYSIDVNSILREKNQRNKKLFDLCLVFLFSLISPILIWFVDNKKGFIRNLLHVFIGKKSWVGYHPIKNHTSLSLPVIKTGVIYTTDNLDSTPIEHTIDKMNILYARNYRTKTDLELIMRSLTKIGR